MATENETPMSDEPVPPSRAAATAYAYDHGLIERAGRRVSTSRVPRDARPPAP